MKKLEVFDSDYEALEILAKVHGSDLKSTVSDLVTIGIKTYADHIAAWRDGQKPTRKAKPAVRTKKLAKKASADVYYGQALALVKAKGKISCAAIQRALGVGYNTAANILDQLIDNGVVVQGVTKSSWVAKK